MAELAVLEDVPSVGDEFVLHGRLPCRVTGVRLFEDGRLRTVWFQVGGTPPTPVLGSTWLRMRSESQAKHLTH